MYFLYFWRKSHRDEAQLIYSLYFWQESHRDEAPLILHVFLVSFWRESRRDEAQSQLPPPHKLFNLTFTFALTFLSKSTGMSTKDCTKLGLLHEQILIVSILKQDSNQEQDHL